MERSSVGERADLPSTTALAMRGDPVKFGALLHMPSATYVLTQDTAVGPATALIFHQCRLEPTALILCRMRCVEVLVRPLGYARQIPGSMSPASAFMNRATPPTVSSMMSHAPPIISLYCSGNQESNQREGKRREWKKE